MAIALAPPRESKMTIISTSRTLFAVAFISVLAACGGESAQEHLAQANKFLLEDNYDSAIIELKNVLQIDKQSAEARWLLGKSYLDMGDILSAEKELQRSLKLGWSHDDVLPALARVMLAQGKYAEVGKLDNTGLQAHAMASLMASKAMAAMALGENRKGKKLIESALEYEPESSEALIAKARILANQGDLANAGATLDELLSRDPDNGNAWDIMGDIQLSQKDSDGALASYTKAIEHSQMSYGSVFKRALLYLRLEKYEEAQADTSELLEVSANHPGANYIQGLLHFQAEKYPEAISAFSVAEPAFKQFPLALFFLASAQLIEGHLDLAQVQAVRFNNLLPESIRGRKLLATIYLQQSKFEDVQELMGPVLDADPNDIGALNLMSNALLRDGKIDEGITLLARVAELQPDSPLAQVRLGAGLLMGGNNDDATQHMESALELAPEFQQADILLVMNHVQKRDFEAAIKAAEAYRKRHLTSVTPYNLLGRVYLEAGQRVEAKAAFEKVLTLDEGDPAANHNLAQMALSDGDVGAARKYYLVILEKREDYLPALLQLAMLGARENNVQEVEARLEQAMKAHPTELQPRLLMARYRLSQGRPDKIAPLFAELEEVQQKSPQVLQLIALAQLSENENTEAQYTLEQLMESTTDTPGLHLMMAKAALGSGDGKRAERELRKALELDKNYLPARISLTRVMLAGGRIDEFNDQLEILQAQAPDNVDVLILRAASAAKAGNSTEAIILAEQAYALAPVRGALLALASHKAISGDNNGARQLYRDWLDTHPDDVIILLVLADSLYKAQEIEGAVTQYEKVLKLDPDNVTALNNVAWHIRERKPAKALEYIQHAASLMPDSADVMDTLAVVEYGNKNYVPALRAIDRALDERPNDLTLMYHRAMILAGSGESSAAIKLLEKIFSGGDGFPEVEEAKELLDNLNS